jgi:hypothetical protein
LGIDLSDNWACLPFSRLEGGERRAALVDGDKESINGGDCGDGVWGSEESSLLSDRGKK